MRLLWAAALLAASLISADAEGPVPMGARMSSDFQPKPGQDAVGPGLYQADNCINGDTESSSTSNMCHTDFENAPWLAIDFGGQVDVKSVTIYNRKDGHCADGPCAGRFRNAEVRVVDVLPTDGTEMFTGGRLLGDFEGPATNGQVIRIQIPIRIPIRIRGEKYLRGRYVLVQQGNRNYLNLHEVTVEAIATPVPVCCDRLNVAGNLFTGRFEKTAQVYNEHPVYIRPGGYWCVFFGGHWKIETCAWIERRDDNSQGIVFSKVNAVCPGNIGMQWMEGGGGSIDTSIKVTCG